MKVSVFGVGYVGCVTAACLAREGHEVIGVDIDPLKIEALQQGRAPFFEPGLSDLVGEMVTAGRLHATTDCVQAVRDTEIALICVATPSQANGSIRLDFLKHVFADVGKALRNKNGYFVVALRSTVLPSAIQEELVPLLEAHSGKQLGEELGLVYNPEFLREGSALKDFQQAPWTIIGSSDDRAGKVVARLYEKLTAPLIRTDPNTAVLVKYFSNAFHALKVAFANEASQFCREVGIDSREVMRIFCQDNRLNISARYLQPGFAFGGSCLPKDLKALRFEARRWGLNLPVMDSILDSNESHLRHCIQRVTESGKRRIGIVGLTFKAGTDDLRESPAVELAERLIGKGLDVMIYEPAIAPGKLHGANLAFIERAIPHIWKFLVGSLEEIFLHAETVVVTQQVSAEDRLKFVNMAPDQICIDLAGSLLPEHVGGAYETIDTPQEELLAAV
jgi:GDP-mannose 6-dehydrogenase